MMFGNFWIRNRKGFFTVGIPSLLAAIVIGCGGSGDGTTGTSTIASGSSASSSSSSATASTTTASTTTSSTSTASTATSGGPGILPKNKIFYDELKTDTVEYRYIDPAGSGDTLYASLPFQFSGFSPNPVVANQFFFGGQISSGAKWRIYKNSSISFGGATNVTPNISFDAIYGIQVANNGSFLLFTAVTGSSSPKLYYLELKSPLPEPIALDDADRFHISPLNNKVVYSKAVGGFGAIFIKPLPTGDAVKIVDVVDKEDFNPQFNKTASKIVFSSDRDATFFDLYTANVDGTNVTRITNTPDVSEGGASFNEAGDSVAYVGSGAATSLIRLPIGGASVVLKESAGLNETRWTGSDGKAKSAPTGSVNVGLTPKKHAKAKENPPVVPVGSPGGALDLYKPDKDLKDGQ